MRGETYLQTRRDQLFSTHLSFKPRLILCPSSKHYYTLGIVSVSLTKNWLSNLVARKLKRALIMLIM